MSQNRSRWGWKGLNGDFAFFTLNVQPGANPAVDAWAFSGGGLAVAAGRVAIECTPIRRDNAWEFLQCTGLRAEDTFRAAITGNDELEVTLSVGFRSLKEKLTRIPDKDEPVGSANARLLWQTKGEASYQANTGLWAAEGLVFAPHFGGVVEILDALTGKRLGVANVSAAVGRNPSFVTEVTARGGYLYAATTSKGVVIFDVRDPSSPRLAGQHIVEAGGGTLAFTNVHTLTLGPDGRTLYAVNHSHPASDLRAIDVSNPAAPREVGRYQRPGIATALDGFHDVYVTQRDGRTIGFLHSLRSGLFIVDLTEPAAATEVGATKLDGTLSHSGAAFEAGGRKYYAHNDEGFDQGMTVLDVTDLSKPVVVSRYQTRRGTSIHNIDIVGGFAYLSYYVDGLRVVDLRDPARPREVAHYDTVAAADESELFQGAWGVKVLDGRVFVSDMASGVFAVQVTLPP